jgi:hypothetical protein
VVAPDEERPAKVAKTEGPEFAADLHSDLQNVFQLPGVNNKVLEDRVKVKVQQILAGAELSNTTIGMLRSALEEKLGLQPDSLLTTKRLRKWLILQYTKLLMNRVELQTMV